MLKYKFLGQSILEKCKTYTSYKLEVDLWLLIREIKVFTCITLWFFLIATRFCTNTLRFS